MEEEEEPDLYVPLKFRKQGGRSNFSRVSAGFGRAGRRGLNIRCGKNVSAVDSNVGNSSADAPASLLEMHAMEVLNSSMTPAERARNKLQQEEERLLEDTKRAQKSALVSHIEKAVGLKYKESMKTSWRPALCSRNMSPASRKRVLKKHYIIVDGEDIPPPVQSFKGMRFPAPILRALAAKSIHRPNRIQLQGLPVVLSGRDMIGIAFTGSGKTLTFTLPLIMFSMEEEMKLPVVANEGPIGIIMCPSRELASQTWDVITHFTSFFQNAGYPPLRSLLAVGGESKNEQLSLIRRGIHIIAATPGRLNDFLSKRQVTLNICKYICLDEADRMLDVGFDEEVQRTFSFFTHQRQTLLFSATMPKKVQDFAHEALVRPVIVNVGRAGAASLDVIQEIEFVEHQHKMTYLLECLQKTPPPVIIFSKRSGEVDDIVEYLIIKGVAAVSIHGSKDQEERREAMRAFRANIKDVLVATDVAAKGIDLPNIQHVINFDMPDEIENYIHRIGRTGRSGKTGVATSFINNMTDRDILLDLKGLLIEAKQRMPPVLAQLQDPRVVHNPAEVGKACAFCGGLGHSISNCPKIIKDQKKLNPLGRDAMRTDRGDW